MRSAGDSHRDRRGGAPVGYLKELPALEAAAVIYLRLWCSGPETQAQVWNDFAVQFGGREGSQKLKAFERLMSSITDTARRPVMRHHVECACLGADEAVFANLIGAAANEDTIDDAALFAALLVRPGMATTIATRAQGVARSLCALCGAPITPCEAPTHRLTQPQTTTRH